MNTKNTPNLGNILASFVGMGIFIVLFIVGLIFFSYLLIIGGIVGLILFGIAYLRLKFFSRKNKKAASESHGRIIDQDKE
ncbi:MAG: hypothetical protein KDH94_05860 [Coxiellaceae bacterium]|nr:hypothetical protein [Coxiellaceae bacterium]